MEQFRGTPRHGPRSTSFCLAVPQLLACTNYYLPDTSSTSTLPCRLERAYVKILQLVMCSHADAKRARQNSTCLALSLPMLVVAILGCFDSLFRSARIDQDAALRERFRLRGFVILSDVCTALESQKG